MIKHQLKRIIVGILFAAICGGACAETFSHGRFKDLPLYRPKGTLTGVVLLLSGAGGWTQENVDRAQALTEEGALVVGIDTSKFFDSLDADGGTCTFPDGDLENLSRFVQAYAKLPSYTAPILISSTSGASFTYAMLAQAPATTFAGGLTLGFCPVLEMHKPLCKGENIHFRKRTKGVGFDLQPASRLPVPWRLLLRGPEQRPSLTGPSCSASVSREFAEDVKGAEVVEVPKYDISWIPQLKAGYVSIAARHPVVVVNVPPAVSDLPLIEIPSTITSTASEKDVFIIMISGDGGWAGIDKDMAAAFSKRGLPVVGVDSLRYFWNARTPASAAGDIDRLIRFYSEHWKRSKVILVGYSQGADVMPFIYNRLPARTQESVRLAVMMGLGQKADFQFHLTNWVSSSSDGLPIVPEVERLPANIGMCVYGTEENDSSCPALNPGKVKLVKLNGGHHFDGNYDRLAGIIVDGAISPATPATAVIAPAVPRGQGVH